MSITIYPGYQQFWIGTGTFDGNLILGQGGTVNVGDFYFDTNAVNLYIITVLGSFDPDTQTYSDCTLAEIVSSGNILTVLNNVGWNINTSRTYSNQSSLGFNTSRRPSVTNDTSVSISVTLTNEVLATSTVQIQISSNNSTFTTVSTLANLTQALNSSTYSTSIIVPAGYYYQLETSGTGTHTLVNLNELSM